MYAIPNAINLSLDFGFFWPFITFFLAFFISYISYPAIIRVSKMKKLAEKPNWRSVHTERIPNLGGVGIFISLNLIITFLGNYLGDENLLTLLGAVTILFFIGLIDDLIGLKPLQKILGQVVASLAVILITNLRVENFYGFLGLHELPYLISVGFTLFVFVLIINAYNLIDGVDGLAGSFAVTISLFFAIFFFANDNNSLFFLSISIIGALISFLIFNFSKKEKIFMGDTGSMVLGFLLAYQALNFLNVSFNPSFVIQSVKSPIYILALFSFPLLDVMRVFSVRLLKKKSPFSADKNHIHHVFLDFGLEHWKISALASVFTVSMVFTVFIFNDVSNLKQAVFLFVLWITSIIIVNNLKLINTLRKKSKKKSKTKKVKLDVVSGIVNLRDLA
ncbi:glycosyltransferase family 4 protein [uncultured Polaribacter sp.]|uniref:glycosyltransferase family 4 protein n=1 Tax=uncultured Polaribacter sp. TaxID=174711 RepID=UPI0026315A6D|nr:MraY family glycosyltransferase [uncultured Polaribacter sp.]